MITQIKTYLFNFKNPILGVFSLKNQHYQHIIKRGKIKKMDINTDPFINVTGQNINKLSKIKLVFTSPFREKLINISQI